MELVPDTPCIHNDGVNGLTVRTCSMCLGALSRRPYRQHVERIAPGFLPDAPKTKARDCEICPKLPSVKGNRVFVRLPRPPRGAFGKDVPPYPPSWDGPLVMRPRIFKATHRRHDGRYCCDRCDPDGRIPIRAGKPERPKALTAADVFAD